MAGTVNIGLIGAGFLAETRMRCYAQVPGFSVSVPAVAARSAASARDFADRHGIAQWHTDVAALLANPDIQMVDLCVPNHVHRDIAVAAAEHGKHVVCTKPLTAYTGQDLPADATDADIAGRDPALMLEHATQEATAMVEAARRNEVQLMYGENWIFAPPVQRAEGLMVRSGGSILEMRGGEAHCGSHSPYSKIWRYTGGGALLRLGAHPIGTMLYLKQQEGVARNGRPIRPVSVMAETRDLTTIAETQGARQTGIATGWQDVETWATALITFEDGSVSVAYGSDNVLGGMQSWLELFLSNSRIRCNIAPHDLVELYAPGQEVFEDTYLNEKASTTAGWNAAIPDEDWSSGHVAMCHHFIDCAVNDKPTPCDGVLGLEVTRVIYAAYQSAREGRRISL